MSIVYVVVTILTVAAIAGVAVADLAHAGFVLDNSAEVGLSSAWLPLLAALKGAGAAGLLIGLLGVQLVGVLAASGLVVFFIGAVIVHIRAGVFYNIAFPGTYLVLSLTSLALAVAR
jgi:hypothetical protein